MLCSVFDIFSVGVGPSSSHTTGPMRAARMFADELRRSEAAGRVQRLRIDLFGSLAATGAGHGTDMAVLLGLEGERPELVETSTTAHRVARIKRGGSLRLLGARRIAFSPRTDLVMHDEGAPARHPNAMLFQAFGALGEVLARRTYDSVGGGTVVQNDGRDGLAADHSRVAPRHAFSSGLELLELCRDHRLSVSELVMRNELSWRSEADVRSGILSVWRTMRDCVSRGCETHGYLPGELHLPRRAPDLRLRVSGEAAGPLGGFFTEMDWLSLHAVAVAEENAAGGRVVTAPTNGSAGIVPAVLHHLLRAVPGAAEDMIVDFLLAAAAIGSLYKENASISGAEVGCQGEIGVACSMAAAGLAHALGATPEQVETAAEIGMEHNLGLTCDPVAGLVQIPCIERNALGAVMAVAAARLALQEKGEHLVSLDSAIETMRQTGLDMNDKYKETARGGLAMTMRRVPVGVAAC
jgi:L-serine dehydratase